MDKYEIIITDDAVKELDDIGEYIADVLQAPKSALAYLKVIREAINKLETYPQRIAVVSEAPWGDYGVRRIVGERTPAYRGGSFLFQRVQHY